VATSHTSAVTASAAAAAANTTTANTAAAQQQGVKGILDAYQSAIARVQLSGPTLFAEVIKAAASTAALAVAAPAADSSKQAYTVLLILTDGIINDMDATKDVIVAASGLPLRYTVLHTRIAHALAYPLACC
jgi:Copine